jgi:DNA-directed RNA polymerase subunit L
MGSLIYGDMMEVEVLENADKVKIKVDDLTFVNLLNENIWKQKSGLDYAAYAKDHPYMSQPILTIKSKDAKKSLIDAAERIQKDVEELRKKFEKAVK